MHVQNSTASVEILLWSTIKKVLKLRLLTDQIRSKKLN